MLDRIMRWLDEREAEATLRRLDDHLLADMGVPRDEIRARARGRGEQGGACGKPSAGHDASRLALRSLVR